MGIACDPGWSFVSKVFPRLLFRRLCVLAVATHLVASAPGAEPQEPRVAVSALNCPGDAQHAFIVRRPGSYYLAENLTVQAGQHGILIAADDVSLDLNGFALRGANVGGNAIVSDTPRRGARVQRGSIVDWLGAAVLLNGKGTSVAEIKVLDCRGGIVLDEFGSTRISRCEVRDLTVLPGHDTLRATLVESCVASGIRSSGDVIAIRASTVSACDVTGVQSASGWAGGIFAEVVTGSRVEGASGVKGGESDFGIRARVVHASGAPDVPVTSGGQVGAVSPVAPAPRPRGGRSDAEYPGGLTLEEFRQLAKDAKNDLRLLSSALEQYAIENNKAAEKPAPQPAELARYFSKSQRLHAELSAGRCVDVLGRPIILTQVGELPIVARATVEHFSSVTPPDFWKPYPVR
ncbi:MAG: hypothetical protein JSR82_05770 [Verrucomicrobia bacterium]|nr:hypothetical protein [Verrucomicrobiota bacterium]